MPVKNCYCEKCNKTMAENQFYLSNNLEKYPDGGRMTMCKKCLTMHVDNWDPDTYLWILQEVDVPYAPWEWDKLLGSYARDPSKVTGLTILGRYLSKMKLKQYKDYRWKDTEFVQQLNNKKIAEAMKRQGYEQQQITEAIEKATFTLPVGDLLKNAEAAAQERERLAQLSQEASASALQFPSGQKEDDEVIEFNLTEEEQLALKLKWGNNYKPAEWIQLEKLYVDMMNSYDIQTAGHIDTLKLICKTSLKANKLLDLGDVDGAQKMVKMYDSLMKSGKFTAAQNKAENGEFVDSISELVAVCEKEGFIPRYYTDGPQDKVDRVIQDMQDYTRTLITEEMHLAPLIERAVRQIEADQEKEVLLEESEEGDEEAFEQALFQDDEFFLKDQDFSDFVDFEEQELEFDEEFYESLMNNGIS